MHDPTALVKPPRGVRTGLYGVPTAAFGEKEPDSETARHLS
ncbi:hypothetical protein ACGFY9_47975 [Streptomyces sp. NPDC048504]